jgi:dienelactone hydrolase
MKRYDWETKHRPLMTDQLIPFLQSKGVDETFAMMGFCYGSWLTMTAYNDETIASHVTCGLHYHPSSELMEKTTFGGDDIALCHGRHKPQLVHATKHESDNWKPADGAAHRALEANGNVPEVRYTLAPDSQNHGFMSRCAWM